MPGGSVRRDGMGNPEPAPPTARTTNTPNPPRTGYVSGQVPVLPKAKEGLIMDPHFHEYLAAVAGMHDVYGEPPCDGTSEFHEEQGETPVAEPIVPAAA
jgi:hypothetical protein